MQTTALQLFDAGYRDLVSVVPPGAKMSERSEIPDGSDPSKPDQRGKAPGRFDGNRGNWAGYNWREFQPLREHVKQWQGAHKANIGLHAHNFPAVDIDVLDAQAVDEIRAAAIRVLGPAPCRIGRAPKTLLVYGTAAPFTRMRLHLKRGDEKGLIEILGDGQQYLVAGTHPGTMKPYEWTGQPLHEWDPLDDLALIDVAKCEAFFEEAEAVLDLLGWTCEREGKPRLASDNGLVQEYLAAPSFEACKAAVDALPNTSDLFPSRDAMNQVGYAIKASVGDAGLELFQDWAGRWADGTNDPDYVAHEWERMVPPFRVGWEWLSGQAKKLGGYSDAEDDFEADATLALPDDFGVLPAPPGAPPAPPAASDPPDSNPPPPKYSDHAVAQRFCDTFGDRFRYVKPLGGWQAYSEKAGVWAPDDKCKAEAAMQRVCASYAEVANNDVNLNTSQRRSIVMALTKAGTVGNALNLARARKPVSGLSPSDFDQDTMLLNTPTGIVDLRTGLLSKHDPEKLHTRSTAVGPKAGVPKRWLAFLEEALGGDQDVIGWLQIMAGYWLTGETTEQQLTFLWGEGGNGKGVFANTLADLMGEYAMRTGSSTFAATRNEQHAEGVARLRGARMVLTSETQEGQAWDEAKVKAATGGDVLTARHMHQGSFDYVPQFKLLFLGNNKPRIRSLDRAMKRRIHLVEMNRTPAKVNPKLARELKAEWPQILQWAIEGCQRWVAQELALPAAVKAATQEYFGEEDIIGQFLEDCCDTTDTRGFVSAMALWKAWERWAADNGELIRTQTWFGRQIHARPGVEKVKRHPVMQTRGVYGIKLLVDEEFEVVQGAVPPKAKTK